MSDCVTDWPNMDTGLDRLEQYFELHQSPYSVIECLSAHDTKRFLALTRMHLLRHLDVPVLEDFFVFKTTTTVEQKPSKTHRRRFGFLGSSSDSCNSKLKGTGKVELENKASILSLTREMAKTLHALITGLSQEKHLCRDELFVKSSSRVREGKLVYELFDDETDLDLDLNETGYDSYDFANVLVKLLEYLNDSLFTQDLFNVFCEIANLSCEDANRKIETIRLVLLLISKENRNLLRHLLCLLRRVSLQCNENRMNAKNLAIVFARCLLCPRTMNVVDWKLKKDDMENFLAFMIEYATELFQVPTTLLTDLKLLINEHKEGKVSPSTKDETDEPVRTALSFCDRKHPKEVRHIETTAEALSNLYAHAVSMPKSLKRWRLIKQFKKENRRVIKRFKDKPKRSFRQTLKKWFCFSGADDFEEIYGYDAN